MASACGKVRSDLECAGAVPDQLPFSFTHSGAAILSCFVSSARRSLVVLRIL